PVSQTPAPEPTAKTEKHSSSHKTVSALLLAAAGLGLFGSVYDLANGRARTNTNIDTALRNAGQDLVKRTADLSAAKKLDAIQEFNQTKLPVRIWLGTFYSAEELIQPSAAPLQNGAMKISCDSDLQSRTVEVRPQQVATLRAAPEPK